MKNKMNGMTWIALIGGMGVAGYMYMKMHPEVSHNMKQMVKGAAKRTYNMMDDGE
mgnify:CR=1 FL=1